MVSDEDIPLARVPISLPCTVPVLPGTMDADAPFEERTERCARDAWWIVGRAPICHDHLVSVVTVDGIRETFPEWEGPTAAESIPWQERHRYAQSSALMLGEVE